MRKLYRSFLRQKRIALATVIGSLAVLNGSAFAGVTLLTADSFSVADALANVALVGLAVLGVKVAWYGIQVAKRMIG